MAPKHRRSDRCCVRRDAETGLEQLAQAARRLDNHLLLAYTTESSQRIERGRRKTSERGLGWLL